MKKILVIGIILLFIGVAVAPSINQSVVIASTDDDLVEVTTQSCGINGYENTTVKLTREQYQNLKGYLVEFSARLNQTTAREEAIPIFKNAVVELDTYGLLPKGMSVENELRFLSLINQGLENIEKLHIFSKLSQAHLHNVFCFVQLQTTGDVLEWGPLQYLISFPAYLWVLVFFMLPEMTVLISFLDALTKVSTKLIEILTYSPLKFWLTVHGTSDECWSIGLMGYKHSKITYSMYGFKGLRVIFPNETYYFGHALAIGV
jgi:hypothetical protein